MTPSPKEIDVPESKTRCRAPCSPSNFDHRPYIHQAATPQRQQKWNVFDGVPVTGVERTLAYSSWDTGENGHASWVPENVDSEMRSCKTLTPPCTLTTHCKYICGFSQE